MEGFPQEEFGGRVEGHAEEEGLEVDVNEVGEGVGGGEDLEELLEVGFEEAGVFCVDFFEGGAEEGLGLVSLVCSDCVRAIVSDVYSRVSVPKLYHRRRKSSSGSSLAASIDADLQAPTARSSSTESSSCFPDRW